MSKLYASISSDARKTEATSRGHKHITSHTRGWDLGVRVTATLDHNGREVFEISVTSGSNGGPSDDLIGRVAMHDGYRYFFPVIYDDERRGEEQNRWLACSAGTGEIPFSGSEPKYSYSGDGEAPRPEERV